MPLYFVARIYDAQNPGYQVLTSYLWSRESAEHRLDEFQREFKPNICIGQISYLHYLLLTRFNWAVTVTCGSQTYSSTQERPYRVTRTQRKLYRWGIKGRRNRSTTGKLIKLQRRA